MVVARDEDRDVHRLTVAALVVTAAMCPLYVVRFSSGPLHTTLLEIALLVTCGVFLVESFRGGLPVRWRTPLTWPALFLLVAGAIAIFVAPDKFKALGLYRAYLVE